MIKKITCKQVQAIMPFYLKGTVNPLLAEIIEEHLESCDKCKDFYFNAIEKMENSDNIIDCKPINIDTNHDYKTKEYQKFKQKLSAYLDSELEDSENIKIKKITISNPLARKDLEDMYSFKRLLHSSFARTMENCKFDFSKQIIKKVSENNNINADNLIKVSIAILSLSIIVIAAFFISF